MTVNWSTFDVANNFDHCSKPYLMAVSWNGWSGMKTKQSTSVYAAVCMNTVNNLDSFMKQHLSLMNKLIHLSYTSVPISNYNAKIAKWANFWLVWSFKVPFYGCEVGLSVQMMKWFGLWGDVWGRFLLFVFEQWCLEDLIS